MFGAGVASLWWMAALTALMVYEKTAPGGRRLVPIAGVAFLLLAAAHFRSGLVPQLLAERLPPSRQPGRRMRTPTPCRLTGIV